MATGVVFPCSNGSDWLLLPRPLLCGPVSITPYCLLPGPLHSFLLSASLLVYTWACKSFEFQSFRKDYVLLSTMLAMWGQGAEAGVMELWVKNTKDTGNCQKPGRGKGGRPCGSQGKNDPPWQAGFQSSRLWNCETTHFCRKSPGLLGQPLECWVGVIIHGAVYFVYFSVC